MSSKIGTKIIFIVVVLLLVVAGLFFRAMHQPQFLANTALSILKQHPGAVIFKEITLEKVRWLSWNKLTLHNLRVKCKIQGASYFFSAGDVGIDHLNGLIGSQPLNVEVKNLAIVNDALNVSDIQLQGKVYFDWFHYQHAQGLFKASRLEWGKYLLADVQSDFRDHGTYLDFADLQGRFYGGEIHLQGNIHYLPQLIYNVEVKIDQIHSQLMAEANEGFSQLTAVIDGNIQINSPRYHEISLRANLKAPLGGTMKASLLRYLAQYVPQRQQIEDLIRQNAQVPLDKAQANILSIDSENISSEVVLNSSSLNLNMKVKFDIHLEGGLGSLLEYIHQ